MKSVLVDFLVSAGIKPEAIVRYFLKPDTTTWLFKFDAILATYVGYRSYNHMFSAVTITWVTTTEKIFRHPKHSDPKRLFIGK